MTRQENPVKCWTLTLNNPPVIYGSITCLIPEATVQYMIQGNEVGESGTPHWQIYVHLKTKVRFATVKALVPNAHIEKAKGNDWQNKLYCSKGEQTHAEWEELRDAGPNYGKNAVVNEWGIPPKAPKDKDTTYEEALDAPTVEAGIAVVKTKRPRDYCLYGDAIERNLKRHKKPCYKPKYTAADFIRPPLTLEKSTLICGSTNCGKSHFALSHFTNPLLVSHIDHLKNLSSDNDGIVFDDMSFTHWPPESVIHLLDQDIERQINIRYTTATIPANTRKIFTHNKENPFYKEDTDLEQQLAIERRLNRVVILGKLY